jgi:ATP-binding cassette subfamily B protein
LSTNGLSFHYPTSGQGIDHVDLNVPRGEFVVVTGRIGSGKTTLLRTLLGLLPADSGSISWNGAIVEDPALFMTPPRTAYTPQVPRLFSLTLRENLLLGHPVSDEELEQAIHTATMEDDLAGMPEGLGTMVGPRGVRLSGGQVQRSAVARMLAREPELFVFDDVSSALDVETEQMLWDRLFSDTDQATALVVSHRRPALQRADRVVVMRDGRIEAAGTADELLESSQEFRRLWSGDFATE